MPIEHAETRAESLVFGRQWTLLICASSLRAGRFSHLTPQQKLDLKLMMSLTPCKSRWVSPARCSAGEASLPRNIAACQNDAAR